MKAIADVLNAVSGHYKEAESVFDFPFNGARTLLRVLDDGNRAHDQLVERLRSGKMPEPGDFNRSWE